MLKVFYFSFEFIYLKVSDAQDGAKNFQQRIQKCIYLTNKQR